MEMAEKKLNNSSFIDACFGKPTSHTPIWIMRQAGRYMKEYRDVRAKVGFLELCKTPELVCEVTTTASKILGVDAAIIFADILLITEALGFDLKFGPNQGPTISNPFRMEKDLQRMDVTADQIKSQHAYLSQAIRLTKKELNHSIPLIGFAGAPFTVASYCIEGSGSKNFENTKKLLFTAPEVLDSLLDKITSATLAYLDMQIEAGVDAIQLFDSWIGCLSQTHAQEYAIKYAVRIFSHLKQRAPHIPTIYFGVHSGHVLEDMLSSGCDVIGIDYHLNLKATWDRTQAQAVQGNLDPCVLMTDRATVHREATRILDSCKGRSGHIFNLGHGILPQASVDLTKYLVEVVHGYQK